MEWDQEIDISKRKFSSQLIVQRALARGWRVAGFKTNNAIFLLHIPGRDAPIKIFSASPPQMSYPAAKIAKDKFITNQILSMAKLPVPEEVVWVERGISDEEISSFISKHGKVVVKPLNASHGKGITVNLDTLEKVKSAIAEASKAGVDETVLIQQQVEGIDIRALCIDYKFTDAISRIPASIVGDGEHNVEELINITNKSEDRGENYTKKLNVIPLDKAKQFLTEKGLSRIPAQNEAVQVIGVSNIGMGGVRQNIKNDIPDWLKEYATEAAKALGLPVCGIDFMVKELPSINSTQKDINPYIIEVNECPMLTMYDDLHSSEQYKVIDKYLDLLAKS